MDGLNWDAINNNCYNLTEGMMGEVGLYNEMGFTIINSTEIEIPYISDSSWEQLNCDTNKVEAQLDGEVNSIDITPQLDQVEVAPSIIKSIQDSLDELRGKGSAKRYNQGKTQLDLIPPFVIEELGRALTYGAEKYGKYNYRKGMEWSKVL
ncbi:MAG TPA: dATP/dGTP diphosphohydrolase domain-containing protein, partial [Bacteroidaceae bacterium]|nr:dATP/dGTP diphosphohydrolase domain-containing protein [Bacteroidaceae bacterium]